MIYVTILTAILLSTVNLTITEPIDGETYEADWLTVRAIVENDNEMVDSVHYSLNGQPTIPIPRLNTDWYTYMANDSHTGFSESPAPTDNTILWTAPVTGDTHEFPTPVIVDGIVYYPSDFGTDSLYALDAATGELIWKYFVGYTDDAVTVKDGRLYIASDSVFCLDSKTGERIWSNGYPDFSGSTPVVTNRRVYCGRNDYYEHESHVICLDAETGTEVWVDTLSGDIMSCMAVWNDRVFVPTCRENEITPLYSLSADDGEILWENTDGYEGYWDSSPVIVDSVIYINGWDGNAHGIDAITGMTVWEVNLTPGGPSGAITATPAYYDDRLYFADQIDSYYCLGASEGSTIWTFPGWQHGSSAAADGMVFYGDCSTYPDSACFIALNCETGLKVWSYTTSGSWFAGSPSVTDGVVYMPAHDWNLYAFGTGLKYTYLDDLYGNIGSNELIVTSFDEGVPVAADTIFFTVTGTGVEFEPSSRLDLCISPNPFYSSASISFELSEPGWTLIIVYDLSGRIVRTLENSELGTGQHSIVWDGRRKNGEPVSAGLYLCRIKFGGISETTGLCLLR